MVMRKCAFSEEIELRWGGLTRRQFVGLLIISGQRVRKWAHVHETVGNQFPAGARRLLVFASELRLIVVVAKTCFMMCSMIWSRGATLRLRIARPNSRHRFECASYCGQL